MGRNAGLASATAAAAAEALEAMESEGTAAQASEATETKTSAPPSSEGAPSENATETGTSSSEATAEAEGTADELSRYFDVDLSGLTAEERTAVVNALRERDDYIGRLLRSQAEGSSEEDVEVPEEVEESPLTEQAILEAFGLDPEDPFDAKAAKLATALVPQLAELRGAVSELVELQELRDTETEWRSEYDRLSKQYGELPVSFDGMLEFAAANNIAFPEDAYWRIAGPARKQLQEAVQAKLAARTAEKKRVTTTRPSGGAGTEEAPLDMEKPNVKVAVKNVMQKYLDELGIA